MSSIDTLEDVFSSPATTEKGASQSTLQATQDSVAPQQRSYLGPLQPDHIREALRRINRDGDTGGTGATTASLGLGIPGSKTARIGGRRMFQ